MRKSYTTGGIFSSPDGRVVGDRITAFLRDKYPVKTAESVAADTGLSVYTVTKWLGGSSLPNCLAIIVLTGTYGPSFMMAVWPSAPRWLDEAHRAEQQRSLQSEIENCRARLEALGH